MASITLKEAWEIWEQNASVSIEEIHPDVTVIQKLAKGEDLPEAERERWWSHLADCKKCMDLWIEKMAEDEAISAFTDVAIPKAASGPEKFRETARIKTESGKCIITFRRSMEREDACLVTLQVIADAAELEGSEVVVRDSRGTPLIRGRIIQGKLSGWVERIDDIDETAITVVQEGDW